jgi:hypothetical protein
MSKTPRRAAAPAKKRRTKDGWDKHFEELEKRLAEQGEREHLSWSNRPRVHTAIFEEVARDEKVAELGFISKRPEKIAERARELDELAKTLGLSGERLALFKQLVVAYRKEPTIENYVRVRREFPDVEIQVGHFAGIDPLFALERKFRGQGIDPALIAGALDANKASIDALSLCLLERLIARGKLPKQGPQHIEERRNAISGTTVNYLISTMLEALDWNNEEIRMPASLVVLIREQLCGTNPDLHAEYLLREKRFNAAFAAAQHFYRTKEKISVRKLAAALSVKRSTAARWLADKEFLQDFEWHMKFVASKVFQQLLRDEEASWTKAST